MANPSIITMGLNFLLKLDFHSQNSSIVELKDGCSMEFISCFVNTIAIYFVVITTTRSSYYCFISLLSYF